MSAGVCSACHEPLGTRFKFSPGGTKYCWDASACWTRERDQLRAQLADAKYTEIEVLRAENERLRAALHHLRTSLDLRGDCFLLVAAIDAALGDKEGNS